MKPVLKLSLLCFASLLISCEITPTGQDSPANSESQELIEQLHQWLPGVYSNYAQLYEAESDRPVTDVYIRQLITTGEPVYLFENTQRESNHSSHDIYWLKTNRKTQKTEFHFTYLKEEELSLALADILRLAWKRVKPGCVIELAQSDGLLSGKTNTDTCLFDHLLQGETKLNRSLLLTADTLEVANDLLLPGKKASPESILQLQKHRVFEGWAGSRTPAGPEQKEAGEWQLSGTVNIRDDGRINDIRGQNMESIGFGLQLAKLKWKKNEPPYLLLKIINMEFEGIQAYNWFDPENEILELNLDWFQTHLQLENADDATAQN